MKNSLNRACALSKKEHFYTITSICLLVMLGCVFAEYISVSTARAPERVISKKFSVSITLSSEVNDLYSWEAVVKFNPDVLLVLNVENQIFLSPRSITFNSSNLGNVAGATQLDLGDSVFVVSYDDVELGKLVLAETKVGQVSGTTGSGTLATITFGVFGQGSYDTQLLDTSLYDSNLNLITQLSLTALN